MVRVWVGVFQLGQGLGGGISVWLGLQQGSFGKVKVWVELGTSKLNVLLALLLLAF